MGRIKKSSRDLGTFSETELDKVRTLFALWGCVPSRHIDTPFPSRACVYQLREAIQKLCRSTDPLGRSMEYVHEDMSVMKRELEQWKNDYAKRHDVRCWAAAVVVVVVVVAVLD